MAWSGESEDKTVVADRHRRQRRERQLEREEIWTRSGAFRRRVRGMTPITDAIDADSNDAARLEKSRQQAKEGEIHWGVEDEDEQNGKSGAGG
jgi:hypothetical protein